MAAADIPPEMARFIRYKMLNFFFNVTLNNIIFFLVNRRVNRKNQFLPIIQNDFLKTRMSDLQEVTKSSDTMLLEFSYAPIGIGKLRLLLHVEHALRSLRQLGFSKKDVDEVKGIFSDTNVYLLCGTIFVGSIHVSYIDLSP